MEKENRIKFCLPDDLSKSDRMSPERAAEEEFCITPVKVLPVVGVATKERVSELVLPLDVLVCSSIHFFCCAIFGGDSGLRFCGFLFWYLGTNLFVLQHNRYRLY